MKKQAQKVKLPSTAVGRRRLLKLADLLEADAKNKKGIRFDLSTWANVDPSAEPSVSCGTTACAMGLAAISGAFKRAGLSYGPVDCGIENCGLCAGKMEVRLGRDTGFDAAMVLFDVNTDEAGWLFAGSSYPEDKIQGAAAERCVAKRIRDFVAGRASP